MTDPLEPGDDGYLDLGAIDDAPLSEAEESEFAAFAERARAQGPIDGWRDKLTTGPPAPAAVGETDTEGVVQLHTRDRAGTRSRPGKVTRYAVVGAAAAAIVLIGGFLLLRDADDDAAPITDVADEVEPDQPARLALSVTGGNSHNCALDPEGDIWCWGLNGGRIGDGTTADTATPARVAGNHVFTAVSAGSTHTCALDADGAMWCWGENSFGQLGNGTFEDATVPTAVAGGVQFASLSTGGTFTCGIDVDGMAWCWGNNELGATGQASPNSNQPGPVEADALFVDLATGSHHACGQTEARELVCWGNNTYGQLGVAEGFGVKDPEGEAIGSSAPLTVPGQSGLRQIALSDWSTCALDGSGHVACWGRNGFGELANREAADRYEPQGFAELWEVTQLAADGHHFCALGRMRELVCWGFNAYRQIGPDAIGDRIRSPKELTDLPEGTTAVIAGNWHNCVIADGVPWCWGRNAAGQLGRGTVTDDEAIPAPVTGFGAG